MHRTVSVRHWYECPLPPLLLPTVPLSCLLLFPAQLAFEHFCADATRYCLNIRASGRIVVIYVGPLLLNPDNLASNCCHGGLRYTPVVLRLSRLELRERSDPVLYRTIYLLFGILQYNWSVSLEVNDSVI